MTNKEKYKEKSHIEFYLFCCTNKDCRTCFLLNNNNGSCLKAWERSEYKGDK